MACQKAAEEAANEVAACHQSNCQYFNHCDDDGNPKVGNLCTDFSATTPRDVWESLQRLPQNFQDLRDGKYPILANMDVGFSNWNSWCTELLRTNTLRWSKCRTFGEEAEVLARCTSPPLVSWPPEVSHQCEALACGFAAFTGEPTLAGPHGCCSYMSPPPPSPLPPPPMDADTG